MHKTNPTTAHLCTWTLKSWGLGLIEVYIYVYVQLNTK